MARGTLRVSRGRNQITSQAGRSYRTGKVTSTLTDFTSALYKRNVSAQDELIRQQVAEGLITPEEEARYWMEASQRDFITPKQRLDFEESSRNSLEDAQLGRIESAVARGEATNEDLKGYYQEKLSKTVTGSDRALKLEGKIRGIDSKIVSDLKSQAADITRQWNEGESKIRDMITLGQASKYDLLKFMETRLKNIEPSQEEDQLRIEANITSLKAGMEREALKDMGQRAAYAASQMGGDDESQHTSKLDYLQKAVDYASSSGDEDGILRYSTQLNNAQTTFQEFQDRKFFAEEEFKISQIGGSRSQDIQMRMDRTLELYRNAVERGDEVRATRLATQYNNLQESLSKAYEASGNKAVREQIKSVRETEQLEDDIFKYDMQQINTIPNAEVRLAATIAEQKKYLFGSEPTEEDPEGWTGLRTITQLYRDMYEKTEDASLLNTIRDNERALTAGAQKLEQVIVQQIGISNVNSPAYQEAIELLKEIEGSNVYSTVKPEMLEKLGGTMGILVETDKYGQEFEKPIKLNAQGYDPETGEMYDFMIGTSIAPIRTEDGQTKYIKLRPVLTETDDPRYPAYYRGEYKGQTFIRAASEPVYDEGGAFKVLQSIQDINKSAEIGDYNARNLIQGFIKEGVITDKDLLYPEPLEKEVPFGPQQLPSTLTEGETKLADPNFMPIEPKPTGIQSEMPAISSPEPLSLNNQPSELSQNLQRSGIKINLDEANRRADEARNKKDEADRRTNELKQRLNVSSQVKALPGYTRDIVAPKVQETLKKFTPVVQEVKKKVAPVVEKVKSSIGNAASKVKGFFKKLF